MGAQRRLGRFVAGGGEVGDEPGRLRGHRGVGALPGDQGSGVVGGVDGDGTGGDRGVAAEYRLDLGEFHAYAAELHLSVHPAQVFQLAVRQYAYGVPGAVEAPAVGAEGVGEEGERGALRVTEVAASHDESPDEQLPRLAVCAGVPLSVLLAQYVQFGVADGRADRQVAYSGGGRAEFGVGDVVRALGGAVGVEQPDPRQGVVPPPGQRRGQLLAGGDHPAQRAGPDSRGLLGVEQEAHQGGHGLQHRGSACAQLLQQQGAVLGLLVGEDLDPAADEQRCEHLPDGDVEAQRRGLGQPVVGGQPEVVDLGPEVVEHPPVLDDRGLGAAGRARGVEDVAHLVGGGRPGPGVRGVRGAGWRGGYACRAGALDEFSAVRRCAGGQQQCRAAVGEEGLDAGGGPARVDREVDGAEQFEGEEGGDDVGAAAGHRPRRSAPPGSRRPPAAPRCAASGRPAARIRGRPRRPRPRSGRGARPRTARRGRGPPRPARTVRAG